MGEKYKIFYKAPSKPVTDIVSTETIKELRSAGYIVIPEKEANKINFINDVKYADIIAGSLINEMESELNNYNMLNEKLEAFFYQDGCMKTFKNNLKEAFAFAIRDAFNFIFSMLVVNYKNSDIYGNFKYDKRANKNKVSGL